MYPKSTKFFKPVFFFFIFSISRRSVPLHSAREAEPCHGLHPLPLSGSPTGHCWAALLGLAGWSRPVWSRLACRRERPLPHQCTTKELRRRWAWGADSLQQPKPYGLSRYCCTLRRLLLQRYQELSHVWLSQCKIVLIIAIATTAGSWDLLSIQIFN